jgi:Tfp pilus assembly major pilin PilA
LRALEVEEILAKSRLVEAEAKATLMNADDKSKVLEPEAKIMTEENQIMFTDLATISDPVQ